MRYLEGIAITRTPRSAAGFEYLKQRVMTQFPNAEFAETIRPEPLNFNLVIFVDQDQIEEAQELSSEALLDVIVEDFEDPLPIVVSVDGPESYDPNRHGQLYVEPAPVAAAVAD